MREIAGRYEIGVPLGRGGMSQVHEGVDLRLNRPIAIKLVRADIADESIKRRFYREARITARLRHPGIPVLYDFGTDDGEFYLILEHLGGCTIADLIAEADGLSPAWAATLGAQLCAALAAAHAEGLIHRDIKPSNVMVSRTGLLKLVDFGVAAALDPADYSRITAAGEAPGTFGYLPPEILSGGEATPAGDLYAVGCLLYEMLTGQPAVDARGPFDAAQLHRSTTPPPVTEKRPDVPDAFGLLIGDLLAKDPVARPQTALDAGQRLLEFAGSPAVLPGLLDQPSPAWFLYALSVKHIAF